MFRSGIIAGGCHYGDSPRLGGVYKNPNFTPGAIVGYAPVYPGVNTNV